MLLLCLTDRIELFKSTTVHVHVHVCSSAEVLHIAACVRKQMDAYV